MRRKDLYLLLLVLVGIGLFALGTQKLASYIELHLGMSLSDAIGHADAGSIRELLERGANPNERDRKGRTALHIAVRADDLDLAQLLLKAGANPDVEDEFHEKPLGQAARGGNKEMVELLRAAGASLTILDAVYLGDVSAVRDLLRGKPDLLNVRDRGASLLQIAVQQCVWGDQSHAKDFAKIANDLLAAGADPNELTYDTHRPVLHEAAVYAAVSLAGVLVLHGAEVNARDKDGNTALNALYLLPAGPVRARALELAVLLLGNGADPNVADRGGLAPLHRAVRRGDLEFAELVLDHGAHVDLPDQQGRTPLHFAAAKGHAPLVRLLLEHGANPEVKDALGETPLTYAEQGGHQEVVDILLNAPRK